MKKIFLIFLVCAGFLCGCNSGDTVSEPDVIINIPKDYTVNGYRKEDTKSLISAQMPDVIYGSETEVGTYTGTESAYITSSKTETENSVSNIVTSNPDEEIVYYGNINSKVFHMSYCGSVKRMKETNKVALPTREEFLSQGYKPCSRCNP